MSIFAPKERFQSSEIQVNPNSLITDNASKIARNHLQEWRNAKEKENGLITLFVVCGDSRIVTADISGDNKIVSISSIAESGDLKPFANLLQHPMVGQIVVLGHFDHEKINPAKKSISGCGGRDAKARIEEGTLTIENAELHHYITERVSPHFLRNIRKTVEQAGKLSGKPTLGVMVDHLTDAAFPMIELINGKEVMYPEQDLKRFPWRKIDEVQKFIDDYGDYFPQLKIDDLLPVFRQFIEKNRKKAKARLKKDPEFIGRQRIQNPSTVVISTCPIPVALRYPEAFGHPNEAFVIRKAFDKKEAEIRPTDIDFLSIVGQLYYPLKQADFSRTNNILIETPNLEMSAQIAARLLKIPFVQDWVNKRQGKIMIAKLEHHETKEIQYF